MCVCVCVCVCVFVCVCVCVLCTCTHGIQINSRFTLSENIADNGGIHIAYRAYKNVMKGKSEQRIGGYSGDQLFFVAYAQVYIANAWHSHMYVTVQVKTSLVDTSDFAKSTGL